MFLVIYTSYREIRDCVHLHVYIYIYNTYKFAEEMEQMI